MKTSLEIASEAEVKDIQTISDSLGIPSQYMEPYGRYKAKINLDVLKDVGEKKGKYILVTAVTPTPLGEGKTVTTIGLGMGLAKIGKKSAVTLRQSSLGPVFGIKGGGAGGGHSQIIPLEESILHLNGDMHAVTQAHNQIAAMLDNSYFHANPLKIDAEAITFRRVMDVNDRYLRNTTIGQGGKNAGIPRESGFDITAASELMAILALVDGKDATSAIKNLRKRIGQMVLAYDDEGAPVTANDIKAAGSATVLMREALKPNLMQTIENTPAFIHAGPFGNIAHGNSSILGDRVALSFADYVVTEAGFGMDLGGEKFFDIKCRASGLWPDAAVLVATVRALKSHSGNYKIIPGKPLPPELLEENVEDVRSGAGNLRKHLHNLRSYGVPVVVAINRFPDDTPAEVQAIKDIALEEGAVGAEESFAFAEGGDGVTKLAKAVVTAANQESSGDFLYPLNSSIQDKIEIIATKIYGAKEVEYTDEAKEQIARFEKSGFGDLPICMAKTHLSLSHNRKLKGAPEDYIFPIREVRASTGAGFIFPIAGKTVTMPGLGKDPAGAHIDIDEDGNTVGLF
ncbi:formate--tetrahydrofolate ligase [Myxococcota bacterium]|nr:formate--tetrahydrofolate ligase [Myxococcota bacterium]